MTLNTELAILLIDRSDLAEIRAGKTLDEMIAWLINDYEPEMHPEDRLEVEFALSEELMEIFG